MGPSPPRTVAAQRATAATQPADDGHDAECARRWFLATLSDPLIRSADGRPVWSLDAYKFVTGPPPATINPSLWRHAALLTQSGLFMVADTVWPVRWGARSRAARKP